MRAREEDVIDRPRPSGGERERRTYTWGTPRDARANENVAREIYEGTREADPFRALLPPFAAELLSFSARLSFLSSPRWKLAITFAVRSRSASVTYGPFLSPYACHPLPPPLPLHPLLRPSRPLCAAVTGHPARYERSPYLLSPPRDIELRGGAGEDRECSRKGSANLMQFRGGDWKA